MKTTLASILVLCSACSAAPVNQALYHVSQRAQNGFLWSSTGLAVLTAFLQGLVTAMAFMTESSNYWTFRFRIARIEHWWWTAVSALLLVSLVLMVLSFLAGNNNEAISILALSTATFLAIVQYMIPAWRSRHFLENRWLAWTGSSRTSIQASKAVFCGDRTQWAKLVREVPLSNIHSTPSDWYGWRLWPVQGIPEDPTDILRNIDEDDAKALEFEARNPARFIYSTGERNAKNASLQWGEQQGFRRRVSRATSSMPSNLLQSRPFTVDGYVGDGLCLAMGILGRNKGLQPKSLIFNMSRALYQHGRLRNLGAPTQQSPPKLLHEHSQGPVWRSRTSLCGRRDRIGSSVDGCSTRSTSCVVESGHGAPICEVEWGDRRSR